MIPTPGVTFVVMGVLGVVIFLWYFWSEQETGMSTAEFEGGLSVKLDTLLGRDRATKGEDVEGITKPLRERGEPSLLDPVGMVAYSEKLDTEIDGFLTEVDFALSESNARTEVEFNA